MSTQDNSQGTLQREVMSVKEVAAYLGLSESKVRQLIGRNAIPYVKLDGQYKFFLPTIREWLRQRTVQPGNATEEDAHDIAEKIWNTSEGVR
jgi:excisionase family DNA binding protein